VGQATLDGPEMLSFGVASKTELPVFKIDYRDH
jgi:hypothetical protein